MSMAKKHWKDASSYSRGDKNKVPNIWVLMVGPLKISVVYNHIYYPDQWTFSCSPFFEHEELGNISAQEAQDKAIQLVRAALKNTLQAI